jgi:glycosyl transferase family 25
MQNAPLSLLINMDGANERLAHFDGQARQAGVVYDRVSAVDGRAFTSQDLAVYQDPRAIYPLSAAEIGCALSHRKAWQKIFDTKASWGVVFEDDACLQPQTGILIASLPDIHASPTIVKLEATNGEAVALGPKVEVFSQRAFYRLRGLSIGTAGYAINRAACANLLAQRSQYAVPMDLYLFSRRFGAVTGIDVFMMDPALVIQADRLAPLDEQSGLVSGIRERGKRMRPRPPLSKMIKRETYRIRENVLEWGATRHVIDWG